MVVMSVCTDKLSFRHEVRKADYENITSILKSTGFFYDHEIEVAIEIVDDHLKDGVESAYNFIFAEYGNKTVGYACFGLNYCTESSYDLYWIAVHNEFKGCGTGKKLIKKMESIVAKRGGSRIYIETSARQQYAPTQKFYLSCGYTKEATIKDFYAPGDDKEIYVKVL